MKLNYYQKKKEQKNSLDLIPIKKIYKVILQNIS